MSNNLLLNICSDITVNICSENKKHIVSNPYIINDKLIWVIYNETDTEETKNIHAMEVYLADINTITDFMESENEKLSLGIHMCEVNCKAHLSKSNLINKNKNIGDMVMFPILHTEQEQILTENIILDTISKIIGVA